MLKLYFWLRTCPFQYPGVLRPNAVFSIARNRSEPSGDHLLALQQLQSSVQKQLFLPGFQLAAASLNQRIKCMMLVLNFCELDDGNSCRHVHAGREFTTNRYCEINGCCEWILWDKLWYWFDRTAFAVINYLRDQAYSSFKRVSSVQVSGYDTF